MAFPIASRRSSMFPEGNSIWDLINSTINRRAERDVQTTGGMRGMCKRLIFLFFFNVYETEFVLKSLMA